ncbi:hypothetical protein O6H91_17G015700 [Diphasiastrum complanatum]|uniref:Uncharacterized protein n=1 Tax=Diphasiastrum complanatum TaxID=34168 RepID=A0ACC2B4I1_DIPCM|nr:hypothetical protein O6H91_17G015700 [Diphasiastrum complanatum]
MVYISESMAPSADQAMLLKDFRASEASTSSSAPHSTDYSIGKNGSVTKRNNKQRRSSQRVISETAEIIVVAFDAAKEIRKHTLEWALTNIVQPGDCITILAVVSSPNLGWKAWSISKFSSECTTVPRFGICRETSKESCRQILRDVQELLDAKKVHVRIKVVQSDSKGVAALEAKNLRADWVVLDRHLKKDGKYCMQQLNCNIVLVNHHDAKILRLNLKRTKAGAARSLLGNPSSIQSSLIVPNSFDLNSSPAATESSDNNFARVGDGVAIQILQPYSPEDMSSFTSTDFGTSFSSSSDSNASPFFSNSEQRRHTAYATSKFHGILPADRLLGFLEDCSGESSFKSDKSDTSPPFQQPIQVSSKHTVTTSFSNSSLCKKPSLTYGNFAANEFLKNDAAPFRKSENDSRHFLKTQDKWVPSTTTLMNLSSERSKLADMLALPKSREDTKGVTLDIKVVSEKSCSDELTEESEVECEASTNEELVEKENEEVHKQIQEDLDSSSSLRKGLSRRTLAGPPPLCSICRYKSPAFGRPPKKFTYQELQLATNGFSQTNFLAEGGFGSVHKGVLPDGQAIAVKQHKLASSQGDNEFCSEVEVLSCAQHRNVVTLIGYCMEDSRRLLVYEFICNGSLDSHLYGHNKPLLKWESRQKIAVGAARGLRYLHEECRVGCIIHRDLRPNNILLTHDFEPMVGDFGLARWQPDGHLGVETRVIGTFGYLAPEYVQSGQITEKADVYSFGVVLLELATGRKAIDYNRCRGQQCLTEWARPFLEGPLCHELADPCLKNSYNDEEMYRMLQAASLCICRDPHLRPRMSQILRILEGDVLLERSGCPTTSQQHSIPDCNKSTYNGNNTSGQLDGKSFTVGRTLNRRQLNVISALISIVTS